MDVTIDRAGRVVIPRSLRESIGLPDGGAAEIIEEDGRLVISPRSVNKRLIRRNGQLVCVADEPIPTLTAEKAREILEQIRR